MIKERCSRFMEHQRIPYLENIMFESSLRSSGPIFSLNKVFGTPQERHMSLHRTWGSRPSMSIDATYFDREAAACET